MKSLTLLAHPFEILLNASDCAIRLALAKSFCDPFYWISTPLSVVTSLLPAGLRMTQWNHVPSNRTGIIRTRIANRYPMVHCYLMPKPRSSAAHCTLIIEVFHCPCFIISSKQRRQISQSGASAMCNSSHLVRMLFGPFTTIGTIFISMLSSIALPIQFFSLWVFRFTKSLVVSFAHFLLIVSSVFSSAFTIPLPILINIQEFVRVLIDKPARSTWSCRLPVSTKSKVFRGIRVKGKAPSTQPERRWDIQHRNLSLLPLGFGVSAGRENPLVEWFMRPFLAHHNYSTSEAVSQL